MSLRAFMSGLRASRVVPWLVVVGLVAALLSATVPAALGSHGVAQVLEPWQQVAAGGRSARWIAPSRADANAVYAAVEGAGVYLSEDGGLNWRVMSTDGLSNLSLQTVAACPDGGVFAGTWGGGVFRLQGDRWSSINSGLGQLFISSVECDASNNVFAGTLDQGIFRLSAGAGAWTGVNAGLGSREVLVVRADGSRLYAGTRSGAYASANGGSSWSPIGLSNQQVYDLEFDRDSSAVLWAAVLGTGVLATTDSGTTWTQVGGDLQAYTVVRDGFGDLYAGTKDDGMHWYDGNGWVKEPVNAPVVFLARLSGGSPWRVVAGTSNGIWVRGSRVTPTATATATASATPIPAVEIRLRNAPLGSVQAGQEITYLIDYQAAGGDIVSSVVISNPVPSGVVYLPGSIIPSDIGSLEDNVVIWRLGSLGPDPASGTVSYRVMVPVPASTPSPTPTATVSPTTTIAGMPLPKATPTPRGIAAPTATPGPSSVARIKSTDPQAGPGPGDLGGLGGRVDDVWATEQATEGANPLVRRGETSMDRAVPSRGTQEGDEVIVTNPGAFASWEYDGLVYRTRSNAAINGPIRYFPLLVNSYAAEP